MCKVIHFHDRQNGTGCFVCKNVCDSARRSGGGNQRPLMNKNHQCVCDVCKCYCSTAYKRHEHTAVTRQAQEVKKRNTSYCN